MMAESVSQKGDTQDEVRKVKEGDTQGEVASVIEGDTQGEVASVIEKKLDPAADFLFRHSEWTDYDVKEARKVLWKIDFRILPFLWAASTLSVVDVSGPAATITIL